MISFTIAPITNDKSIYLLTNSMHICPRVESPDIFCLTFTRKNQQILQIINSDQLESYLHFKDNNYIIHL
jgi:hypothetical protein